MGRLLDVGSCADGRCAGRRPWWTRWWRPTATPTSAGSIQKHLGASRISPITGKPMSAALYDNRLVASLLARLGALPPAGLLLMPRLRPPRLPLGCQDRDDQRSRRSPLDMWVSSDHCQTHQDLRVWSRDPVGQGEYSSFLACPSPFEGVHSVPVLVIYEVFFEDLLHLDCQSLTSEQ